jgi:hypothetical protein
MSVMVQDLMQREWKGLTTNGRVVVDDLPACLQNRIYREENRIK